MTRDGKRVEQCRKLGNICRLAGEWNYLSSTYQKRTLSTIKMNVIGGWRYVYTYVQYNYSCIELVNVIMLSTDKDIFYNKAKYCILNVNYCYHKIILMRIT